MAAGPDKSLATYGNWDASCYVAIFRLILMSLLALRLLGGDVAMLQVVAWTGMIVSRTAESGVAAAVESTFDGEHPCPLCTALKKVTPPGHEQQPVAPDGLITKLKLKDMLRSEDLVVKALAAVHLKSPAPAIDSAMRGFTRSDAPPVPPPRVSVA